MVQSWSWNNLWMTTKRELYGQYFSEWIVSAEEEEEEDDDVEEEDRPS